MRWDTYSPIFMLLWFLEPLSKLIQITSFGSLGFHLYWSLPFQDAHLNIEISTNQLWCSISASVRYSFIIKSKYLPNIDQSCIITAFKAPRTVTEIGISPILCNSVKSSRAWLPKPRLSRPTFIAVRWPLSLWILLDS